MMTTFTIDEQNQIVAFPSAEAAAAATITPFDSFSTIDELSELASQWSAERLLAIWNSLPGVVPAEQIRNKKNMVRRIWTSIQALAPALAAPSERKPTGTAPAATGRSKKHSQARKANASKAAKKNAVTTRTPTPVAPRDGSKAGQVVALLQRKNGATLAEIMKKMGWQKHTVRGFMAGAMKKAGYQVESFKPEGGERSYRLASQ